MRNKMKILFIGDITGRTGRTAVSKILKPLIKKEGISFVIANGENLSGGVGIIKNNYDEMQASGIDLLTSGNHIFDKSEIIPYLNDKNIKILRPLNYPDGVPGRGLTELEIFGKKILVVNILGRIFIHQDVEDPLKTMDKVIADHPDRTIIVDFHAEATSEKNALFKYLDGRVAAVFGTHTHIATADSQVSNKGTAYITDVGMVGSEDSILGFEKEPLIQRFLTQMPQKLEVAKAPAIFNAVILEINSHNKAKSLTQIIKKDL